jgi:hypothetical protein
MDWSVELCVKGLSYFPVYKMQYDLIETECIYIKNLSSERKSLIWWDTVRGKNKFYGLEGVMDQIFFFTCNKNQLQFHPNLTNRQSTEKHNTYRFLY